MTTKETFTATHCPRTTLTPRGYVSTQRGISDQTKTDCVKLSIHSKEDNGFKLDFLVTLQGAKAVAENLLAALAETPEDPAQAKLSLG